MTPKTFLPLATQAARAAGHLFPEYAACEAALESAWGTSKLTLEANNLFGQKQSHPPQGRSLAMPTREFLHGAWLTVDAMWVCFDNWQQCFAHRMALLHTLAAAYPGYGAALTAPSGAAFIERVSTSWSTDPQRAAKVLAVYHRHLAGGVPASA